MPTATDAEAHTITYSYVTASDTTFISYDSTKKEFTFNPTTSTVSAPVTITINARDEDVYSPGTGATFTIQPNTPPSYATAPTLFEMNHSEINKDFLLPSRSTCTDAEGQTCQPTKVSIPVLTSGVLPVNLSIYTDAATGNDYIRANAYDLLYIYAPGTHVMELQLSDPSGCTKYSINLKVKNTKPKFSLSPPVIADFTLKMNEVKTEEVKGMLD